MASECDGGKNENSILIINLNLDLRTYVVVKNVRKNSLGACYFCRCYMIFLSIKHQRMNT